MTKIYVFRTNFDPEINRFWKLCLVVSMDRYQFKVFFKLSLNDTKRAFWPTCLIHSRTKLNGQLKIPWKSSQCVIIIKYMLSITRRERTARSQHVFIEMLPNAFDRNRSIVWMVQFRSHRIVCSSAINLLFIYLFDLHGGFDVLCSVRMQWCAVCKATTAIKLCSLAQKWKPPYGIAYVILKWEMCANYPPMYRCCRLLLFVYLFVLIHTIRCARMQF